MVLKEIKGETRVKGATKEISSVEIISNNKVRNKKIVIHCFLFSHS